jgi:hypothetical protein
MNLEIASFRVTDIQFGAATVLRDGVLGLDREALAAHLREDARLSRVGIEVARPGESIRIPSWSAPDARTAWMVSRS